MPTITDPSKPAIWKYTSQSLPSFDPHRRYSEQELAWWSERACGIACCVAILERRLGGSYSMLETLHEAIVTESYSPAGWIHQKLAELLTRKGVAAIAASTARPEIENTASTHDFICSVTLGFPVDREHKGGHLVACGGIGKSGICIMDPSTQGANRVAIALNLFFSSYSGRAVVIPPV